MDKEYLAAAAKIVDAQATDNPALGVPVDPDVAEFMGAFVEPALDLGDLDDLDDVLGDPETAHGQR